MLGNLVLPRGEWFQSVGFHYWGRHAIRFMILLLQYETVEYNDGIAEYA